MLRRLLDYQLALTAKGKPLHPLRPLAEAVDNFLYEPAAHTTRGPHIRDAIDVKRWMLIVIYALLPCIAVAIWNTGMQSMVYSSGNYQLMDEYLHGAASWQGYWDFALKDDRYWTILKLGLGALLPFVLIAYAVGGFWEVLFAIFRGHEISEGLLVTGILYALILPPTLPYWMAAVGISAGIVLSKEVFGGSGHNIVNPALACRAFLFFTFPGRMSGEIWAGSNPTAVRESLVVMNRNGHVSAIDGYTQATPLAQFNVSPDIKRIHVDAIASNDYASAVPTHDLLSSQLAHWKDSAGGLVSSGQLPAEQLKAFVTSPLADGGLGLSSGYYNEAYRFASLNYGAGHLHDWNLFLGDRLGSMGETSVLACLLGAAMLIWAGIASWRTIVAMFLGAYITALLFNLGSDYLFDHNGAWTAAQFGFPAYKHLLLGGLAFGAVFMATDPVSSPSMPLGKWLYGGLCGMLTIVIRIINPAYPEGVMLAILIGNVCSPLIDNYAAKIYRKGRRNRVRATA
jgi:Na+-transporting NADH:ubiquinone oxidoreductase subunit B